MKERELIRFKRNDRGEYISVKVLGDNEEHIDIRTLYTDKDTGEIKHSPKGVRFSSEYVIDVVKALLQCTELGNEEIEEVEHILDPFN